MRWGVCSSQKKWRGKTYDNCFLGKDGVDFLQQKLNIDDREQTIRMCVILLERCFFHRVDYKDTFSEKALYKFFQDDKKWVHIPSGTKTEAYKKTNLAFERSG